MTFQETERRYQALLERRKTGALSEKQFAKSVESMRVRAPDGALWQIHPEKGTWRRWNGKTWSEATPSAPPAGSTPREKPPPKQPESLLELLGFVLKRFLIGMIFYIPICIVIFLAVWVFHTFVLVYVNEGFWQGGSSSFFNSILSRAGINTSSFSWIVNLFTRIVDGILATKGKGTFTGTVFWMLFMSLIMGAVFRFFRKGPVRYIGDILKTPAWAGDLFKKSRSAGGSLAFLFGGATLGLFLSVVIGSPSLLNTRLLVFVMALHGISAILAHLGTFTLLFTTCAWNDAQKLVSPKGPRRGLNMAWILMGHFGLTVGLLVGSFLPFLNVCGSFSFLLLFIGTLISALLPFLQKGSSTRSGATTALFFMAFGMLLLPLAAQADDGGWQEAGGTLQGWLNSQGVVPAVLLGLFPGLGAVLGTLIGALTGGMVPPVVPVDPGTVTPGGDTPAGGDPPDSKPGSDKPGDDKPGGDKPGDDKPGDGKPGDDKPGDDKPGDDKPGDDKPGDGKPGDDKPGDDKPGDDKPGDDKPGDDKPGGDKPGDDKPGDDKPGDDKPGDDKPGDDKPGDDKPGDDKPGDDKPGDDKPGDDKPGDDKPGDDKPGDDKPGDDKPGDDKPGDDKPGDDKPGDDKPGDDKPGDDKPGDDKPGDDKPGDDKPGDDKPGDDKPGDDKPGDDKPGDDKPGDDKPGDDKPGDDKPGDDKPGDDKPGDDKPGDDKPGDDKPGDDKPGDDDKTPEGKDEPPSVDPEKMIEFLKKWQSVLNQKIKEGYYVKNPGPISKWWNWSFGGIGRYLAGYKGGQCGQYSSDS